MGAIPELSIDSKTLYERLIQVPEGGSISYSELSEVIRRNVQTEAYGNLNTARKMALKEDRILFGTVRGEGLKRLTDVEKAHIGTSTIRKMRRVAKKGQRQLTSVINFDALPNEAKVQHNTMLSLLGAFRSITRQQSVRRLEVRIEEAQRQLPLARTLEAFIR